MKVTAIIPAAGTGSRMGNTVHKQYLRIGRLPILAHTLSAFEVCDLIDSIILIVSDDYVETCWRKIVRRNCLSKVRKIVVGGEKRQDSVFEGLEVADYDTGIVCIHDGVRPFIAPSKIAESIILCSHWDAVVVAVPVKDTVKSAERDMVKHTLDRKNLWTVQTPQAFDYQLIYTAYQRAMEEDFYSTDDSALVERLNHPIKILEGSYDNIKITTPEDLLIAKMILKARGSHLAELRAGG